MRRRDWFFFSLPFLFLVCAVSMTLYNKNRSEKQDFRPRATAPAFEPTQAKSEPEIGKFTDVKVPPWYYDDMDGEPVKK